MWFLISLVFLAVLISYLDEYSNARIHPRALVKPGSAESVPNGTYWVMHTDGIYATLCRKVHNVTDRHFVKMPENLHPALYQEVRVTNGCWI